MSEDNIYVLNTNPRLLNTLLADDLPAAAPTERFTVAIIGAGMAGLAAAYVLGKRGHQVYIYEASERAGGRIRTLHADDFVAESEAAKDALKSLEQNGTLTAEAGAMRFPTSHRLVAALVRKLNLDWQPFINVDNKRNGLIRANAVTKRLCKFHSGSAFGYELNERERNKIPSELLDYFLGPVFDEIGRDPSCPTTTVTKWRKLIREYEDESLASYLRKRGCSFGAREMIGVLENLSSRMHVSLLQNAVEIARLVGANSYYMYRISGGNERLPQQLLEACKKLGVRYHDKTELVGLTNIFGSKVGLSLKGGTKFDCDRVIVAVPLTRLRFIDVPDFSTLKDKAKKKAFVEKRVAVRESHYDAAHKVFLAFNHRFWETGKFPILGGRSITDLPVRSVYYPTPDRTPSKTNGGVLLASYTWGDDARRWDALEETERLEKALDDIVALHCSHKNGWTEDAVRAAYLGAGASHSWARERYIGGIAAIFLPGQAKHIYRTLPNILASPLGHLFFAGEHTSAKHAWVEGAIESGVDAALAVDTRIPAIPDEEVKGWLAQIDQLSDDVVRECTKIVAK